MMNDDDEWWWWMMMMNDDDDRWWWMMMMNDDDEWWWWMLMMNDDDEWWWWMMMMNDDDEWWWWMMMMNDDDEWWWWWMMMIICTSNRQWSNCTKWSGGVRLHLLRYLYSWGCSEVGGSDDVHMEEVGVSSRSGVQTPGHQAIRALIVVLNNIMLIFIYYLVFCFIYKHGSGHTAWHIYCVYVIQCKYIHPPFMVTQPQRSG